MLHKTEKEPVYYYCKVVYERNVFLLYLRTEQPVTCDLQPVTHDLRPVTHDLRIRPAITQTIILNLLITCILFVNAFTDLT